MFRGLGFRGLGFREIEDFKFVSSMFATFRFGGSKYPIQGLYSMASRSKPAGTNPQGTKANSLKSRNPVAHLKVLKVIYSPKS